MKKKFLIYTILICAMTFVLGLWCGCGDNSGTTDDPNVITKEISINVCEQKQLDSELEGTVNWSTKNETLIDVSSNGEILGKSVGQAKVVANNQSKTIIYFVSITEEYIINYKNVSALINEEIQMTVEKNNASVEGVVWSTNNSQIATISSTGLLKGVANGETEVVCSIGEKKIVVPVSVSSTQVVLPLFELNTKEVAVQVDDEVQVGFNYEYQGNDIELPQNTQIKCNQEGKVEVSIENGYFVFVGLEKTSEPILVEIVVPWRGIELTQTLTVNVYQHDVVIELSKTYINFVFSKNEAMEDTIEVNSILCNNESVENPSIIWESQNTDIVEVDSDGYVIAKKVGQANILAKYELEGKTYTAACLVTVNPAPANYDWSKEQATYDKVDAINNTTINGVVNDSLASGGYALKVTANANAKNGVSVSFDNLQLKYLPYLTASIRSTGVINVYVNNTTTLIGTIAASGTYLDFNIKYFCDKNAVEELDSIQFVCENTQNTTFYINKINSSQYIYDYTNVNANYQDTVVTLTRNAEKINASIQGIVEDSLAQSGYALKAISYKHKKNDLVENGVKIYFDDLVVGGYQSVVMRARTDGDRSACARWAGAPVYEGAKLEFWAMINGTYISGAFVKYSKGYLELDLKATCVKYGISNLKYIELYQKDFNNVELFIESITFKTQEQNFDFSYDGADTSAVGLYTETAGSTGKLYGIVDVDSTKALKIISAQGSNNNGFRINFIEPIDTLKYKVLVNMKANKTLYHNVSGTYISAISGLSNTFTEIDISASCGARNIRFLTSFDAFSKQVAEMYISGVRIVERSTGDVYTVKFNAQWNVKSEGLSKKGGIGTLAVGQAVPSGAPSGFSYCVKYTDSSKTGGLNIDFGGLDVSKYASITIKFGTIGNYNIDLNGAYATWGNQGNDLTVDIIPTCTAKGVTILNSMTIGKSGSVSEVYLYSIEFVLK